MNIFPTQHSTLSAPALGEELKKRYGFQQSSCRLLTRNVSDTYLLETDAGKYVFKIYRDNHRKKQEIEGEVALLKACREADLRVSYPVADGNGKYLQSFIAAEGERFGVLFTFAPGNVITDMNMPQLEGVGKEMALFHQLSASLNKIPGRSMFTPDTTIRGPLENLRAAFENLPESYAYLEEASQAVLEEMEFLPLNEFSQGYCQFDFLPKNFHFDAENKVTFFDFDFAGHGPLIYDITSFYIHFFLDVQYKGVHPDAARASFSTFLSSYTKTKSVSETELRSIRSFGFSWWMFYLGFQHEQYDDWSNFFFTDGFKKSRVELMRKWMEHELFL